MIQCSDWLFFRVQVHTHAQKFKNVVPGRKVIKLLYSKTDQLEHYYQISCILITHYWSMSRKFELDSFTTVSPANHSTSINTAEYRELIKRYMLKCGKILQSMVLKEGYVDK